MHDGLKCIKRLLSVCVRVEVCVMSGLKMFDTSVEVFQVISYPVCGLTRREAVDLMKDWKLDKCCC